MRWQLFIDDNRSIHEVKWVPHNIIESYRKDNWLQARNILEVRELIFKFGMPCFVSFDHDLGKNEPSGYDIAKELVELDSLGYEFPEEFSFIVHSKNPVGKINIETYMNNYFLYKASL